MATKAELVTQNVRLVKEIAELNGRLQELEVRVGKHDSLFLKIQSQLFGLINRKRQVEDQMDAA